MLRLASPLFGEIVPGPFAILAAAIVVIVFLIVRLRVHAFLALMLTAFLVGWLTPTPPTAEGGNRWVQSVELATTEFGILAGKIGLVIALASIIGVGLLESGAADRIVRAFLRALGDARAALALMAGGFVLGVPVFFDTVFFLLVPLARALSVRSGKDYTAHILAICGGAVITHSVVAPTPGPLFMVEALGIDLGFSIVVGCLAGIPPAAAAYWTARYLNRKLNLPLRETAGMSLRELTGIISKPDNELPRFSLAILPVALPVLLIAVSSGLAAFAGRFPSLASGGGMQRWLDAFEFLGNKNIALTIGAVLALWLLARQKQIPLRMLGDSVGPALETAAIIILITSAGGAFGAMIKHAGVGEAVRAISQGGAVNYVLLAWLISAVMKIAQGSGTVAMITSAGIMSAVLAGTELPYPPIFIFLAIGFGSMMISWMNDSGFWVVCKLSGFTERETLQSWTVLLAVIALVGLIETLAAAQAATWMPLGRWLD